MTAKSPTPPQTPGKQACKHAQVQIVSRDEDAEFVECRLCGEIFESSEFKDMTIEERVQSEGVSSESVSSESVNSVNEDQSEEV